ncbi:hypothetical protein HanIR_Chr06g0259961 [Helianthus annuus]|nr:hypothetical protein HanIR_Chr06g0259961 [Helianthus annuus]
MGPKKKKKKPAPSPSRRYVGLSSIPCFLSLGVHLHLLRLHLHLQPRVSKSTIASHPIIHNPRVLNEAG